MVTAQDEQGDSETKASESSTSTVQPTPPPLRLLLWVGTGRGVDPVVAPKVSEQLGKTARALGYELLLSGQSAATPPSSAAELWRRLFFTGAQRGVQAYVWLDSGHYAVELVAVSADGQGPWIGRGVADADALLTTVGKLAARMLPPVEEWHAAAAAQWLAAAEKAAVRRERPVYKAAPPQLSAAESAQQRRMAHRLHLALQLDGAFGIEPEFFYAQLLGARFDWRANPGLLLGAYVGYANLPGRFSRANSLLTYGQIEYRVHFSDRHDVSLPLRLAGGYLVNNGAMLRAGIGLNIPLGKRWEIGIDLVAPTFWFIERGPAVSLDTALEAVIRL